MTQEEKREAVQAEREKRFAIACGDFTKAGQTPEKKDSAKGADAAAKAV